MISDHAPTTKSFPVRLDNPYMGRSKPSRFAMITGADEVADVVVMGGKLFCYVDGRRVELRLTGEALALILARGR